MFAHLRKGLRFEVHLYSSRCREKGGPSDHPWPCWLKRPNGSCMLGEVELSVDKYKNALFRNKRFMLDEMTL